MCRQPVPQASNIRHPTSNIRLSLAADLGFGLRILRKNPGFSTVVILSLALGIGANTAVFTLANGYLLRPLPVEEPGRLVALYATRPDADYPQGFSYPDYRDYRSQNDVFEEIFGYDGLAVSLIAGDRAEMIWIETVTGSYFPGLRMRPAAGRLLTAEDDRTPGAHPVAVLSHNFWRQRFAGDPHIAGRTLTLNRQSYTIAGVAAEGFIGTGLLNFIPDLWVPAAMRPSLSGGSVQLFEQRDRQWMDLRARLKPGVTLARAEAAMNTLAAHIAREHYRSGKPFRIHLLDGSTRVNSYLVLKGYITATLTAVAGFVALVLLLACANVANLLLARAPARARELAIRVAVGAGRGRIVRQLLTECAVFAGLGAGLGVIFAMWFLDLLGRLYPTLDFATTDLSQDFRIDWRVLLFTAAVALATVLLFGVAPALRASRADQASIIKGSVRQSGGRRLASGYLLVAAQVALSAILLAGGGLFFRSLVAANGIWPGFDTHGLALFSVNLRLHGIDGNTARAFRERIVDNLARVPGVEAVSYAFPLPLDAYNSSTWFFPEGYAPRSADDRPEAGYIHVGPGYFRAMGTPLAAGRPIEASDLPDKPRVAVINEHMARRYWGDAQAAVGKRFRLGSPDGPWIAVAGVARDGKYMTIGEDPTPYLYFPIMQDGEMRATFLVRAPGDAAALLPAIRRTMHQTDATLPITGLRTMQRFMDRSLAGVRSGAALLGFFALLALLLAAVGIYGVMHESVARRTREIGIRVALGARRGHILGLVVGRAMVFVLVGLALGLGALWAVAGGLGSLLVGVSPRDPATLGAIAALLAFGALAASAIPARRAARVDPGTTLREE